MALNKLTGGEQLILPESANVRPALPASAYTTPAYGDLVKAVTTANDSVNRCAQNDAPVGMVESTNWGNGVLSIAYFKQGVEVILDYTGTLAVGDKVVSNGDKGTVNTKRDRVIKDNTNGVGSVSAIDSPVTGQARVKF